MESVGLGWDAIHERNPRLVMTSITPFGQDGPYADWRATDLIGVAMGGLASLCGSPGRPPIRPSAAQGYTQACAQAVVGTMIAHFHRTRTGRGQRVDQSMQEAVTFTHDNAMPTWDIRGINIGRPGNGRNIGGYQSGQYVYEAADGHVAALSYGGLFGLTARQTVEWLDHHGMAEDLTSEEWLAKLDATQGVLLPPGGPDGDHLNDVLVRFCKRFSARSARLGGAADPQRLGDRPHAGRPAGKRTPRRPRLLGRGRARRHRRACHVSGTVGQALRDAALRQRPRTAPRRTQPRGLRRPAGPLRRRNRTTRFGWRDLARLKVPRR